MISAQLDPAFVAMPNFADDKDAAINYLNQIFSLSDSSSGIVGFGVVKSRDTVDLLHMSDAFPFKTRVSDYLGLYDLAGVYSVNDIVGVLHKIITRSRNIEEVIGFEVESSDGVAVIPDILSECFPTSLRDASKRILFNAALSNEIVGPERRVVCLHGTFSHLPTVEVEGRALTFSGNPPAVGVNDNATRSLNLVTGFSQVRDRVTALEIWRSANHPDSCHLAIALRVLELAPPGQALSYRDIAKFSVGSSFIESLRANQAGGDAEFSSLVLDSCARIVSGNPKEPIGDLTNKKKNVIVRRDDKAEARRTHLTSSGLGLRLMFWETADGPEFANVGVKNELSISDGILLGRAGPQRSALDA